MHLARLLRVIVAAVAPRLAAHGLAPLRVDRQTLLRTAGAALAPLLTSSPALADDASDARAAVARSKSIFDFDVPFRGNELPLAKFRGKVNLMVNIKMDDPQAGQNFQALRAMAATYYEQGLRIWAFPTDQGYFEPDVAEMVRAKAYQSYGFGQYPTAVVFDKIDIVGKTTHPLYRRLTTELANPYGVKRITVNFEKFLLDAEGKPLRRYPRTLYAYDFEEDVIAALASQELPPPDENYRAAWLASSKEVKAGEYAFRSNYNVYDQIEKSRDWDGLADSSFQ
ncbi:thioredoxin-like protein [Pelagophyceae sp. CCMP2097]|nr:thioredoxin-like protein [Pelagophyceae sp. CCMP2097]